MHPSAAPPRVAATPPAARAPPRLGQPSPALPLPPPPPTPQFLYRPKVGKEEAASLADVQRFFMVGCSVGQRGAAGQGRMRTWPARLPLPRVSTPQACSNLAPTRLHSFQLLRPSKPGATARLCVLGKKRLPSARRHEVLVRHTGRAASRTAAAAAACCARCSIVR